MRTFLAVPLPLAAQAHLESFYDAARRNGAGVTWVSPRNMHVTLRFLGETPKARLDDLEPVFREKLSRFDAVRVSATGWSAFPTPDRPRVFFMPVTQGAEVLARLAACVDEIAVSAGFRPADHSFHPHLTLGRVQKGKKVNFPETLRTFLPELSWLVASVEWIESRLTPKGAVYRRIADFPLSLQNKLQEVSP